MAGGEMRASVRLTAWVEGRVQGVGFRWWVRSRALELGLIGFVENLADGRVKVVAEGAEVSCRTLLARLEDGGSDAPPEPGRPRPARPTRPGRVTRVTYRWADAMGGLSGFAER